MRGEQSKEATLPVQITHPLGNTGELRSKAKNTAAIPGYPAVRVSLPDQMKRFKKEPMMAVEDASNQNPKFYPGNIWNNKIVWGSMYGINN